jgi:eukaryotic-like serine/threonine-protein kinase
LHIISGLEAAQALGILHRDVKPSNCFEDADGTIKIGDFGLSISTAARADTNVTVQGTLLGTPAFASPEQLRGEELNIRSDMYSVGVTLFYLLTGRTPFEGHHMVQLIANVLEQPAPSPRKLRPSIPQELARAVLRCLEKQPGERFKNYDELRQGLAPFGSTAPVPAPLGLRFLAGALDMFFVGLVGMAMSLLVFGDLLPFPTPTAARSARMMVMVPSAFMMVLLYYSLFEGLWGACVGKWICRLRVAGPNRNPPGVARAFARALVFQLVPVLPYWVSFGFDPMRFLGNTSGVTQYAVSSLYYLMVAALFCTVRRRNGWAAVHDLLTGTRVVRKMAYEARPVLQPVTETPPVAETLPMVGPYHVLETLEQTPSGEWLLGYDTRLLRKVWIHRLRPGTPPVALALRSLGRAGRLRWIAGRRGAEENWDAYEGITGRPLLRLLDERQPWSRVRFWLLDLAREFHAAEKDGTLPASLALDRVWITADGRAKLLDFTAPGLANDAASSEAPPICEPRPSASQFLNAVASAALAGRMAPAPGRVPGSVGVPLPLHAREFLDRLVHLPGADAIVAALQPLMHQVAEVSRLRRLGLIAGCAAFPVVVSLGLVFGGHMLERWDQRQPGLWELSQLLHVRSSFRMPWVRPSGSPDDRAFAIYIASHYRPIITDSNQWLSMFALSMVQGANRQFAQQSVADHPSPTETEIREATAAVQPILRGLKAGDITKQRWFPLLACGVSWIVYVGLPALLTALLFRGGLVQRALRVAVVRRDGEPASRLRVFWRSLVTWSPVLAAPILIFVLKPVLGVTWATTLTVALVGGLALWSAMLPQRGLQDRLAGTCLVPR